MLYGSDDLLELRFDCANEIEEPIQEALFRPYRFSNVPSVIHAHTTQANETPTQQHRLSTTFSQAINL